jgi:hypothetical protein
MLSLHDDDFGDVYKVNVNRTTTTVWSEFLKGKVNFYEHIEMKAMTAPGAPGGSGWGALYMKTGDDGIFWHPNGGSEVDLTASGSGTTLAGLTDVSFGSLADGDTIYYDYTASLWKDTDMVQVVPDNNYVRFHNQAGAHDDWLEIYVDTNYSMLTYYVNAVAKSTIKLHQGNVTINDAGGNYHFFVESEDETGMISLNATQNTIGIGGPAGTAAQGNVLRILDNNWEALNHVDIQDWHTSVVIGPYGSYPSNLHMRVTYFDSEDVEISLSANAWWNRATKAWAQMDASHYSGLYEMSYDAARFEHNFYWDNGVTWNKIAGLRDDGISFHDNIELDEITAPAGTPTSGTGYLYANASDSKLYWKDDGGTAYDLKTGSGLWTTTNGDVYPIGNKGIAFQAATTISSTGALTFNVTGNVEFTTSQHITLNGPSGGAVFYLVNQVGADHYAGYRIDRDDSELWFVGVSNTSDHLGFGYNAAGYLMQLTTTGNLEFQQASTISTSAGDLTLAPTDHVYISTGGLGVGVSPSYPLHLSTVTTTIAAHDYQQYNYYAVNPSAATTKQYGAMWARTVYSGSYDSTAQNHFGVYGVFQNASTQSIAAATGVLSQLYSTAAGTLVAGYMFRAMAPWITAGSITNLYGLYVEDVSAGSNNWAIYTNAGDVSLGDNIVFRQAATISNTSGSITIDPSAGLVIDATTVTVNAATGTSPYILFDTDLNGAFNVAGYVQFRAHDSGGANTVYARIDGVIGSPTAGSERGRIYFYTTDGGTNKLGMSLIGGTTSAAVELRVLSEVSSGAPSGIQLWGDDSGGGPSPYAGVGAYIIDNTATQEDGRLDFNVAVSGTLTRLMDLDGGAKRLSLDSGTVMSTGGTAFPGSPSAGDRFYRTDLNMMAEYDGTQWLSVHEYAGTWDKAVTSAASSAPVVSRVRTDYEPYFTRVAISTYVEVTNNGTNYWTVSLRGANGSYGSTTTIYTFSTISDSADTVTDHEGDATTADPTNNVFVDVLCAKTGNPGDLTIYTTYYYRLILT